ncbi:hypothetical protein [Mycolicibacterium poriferae]|jgi:hypothetical protein|uniref:hypothetical protein n=1 Tax=Mycolicibacterium poriferae TaxID=39694 RepID=UPI000AD66BC2|nr:hypothetical protein [Mycolicibacterium poriferae]
MLVWIDSAPETYVPRLALDAADVLPDRWNGWLRPLATAEAVGAFLDAWRRTDPNGIWGWATEVGDTLIVTRSDDEEPADTFPQVGATGGGAPLYDLTGWAWTTGVEVDSR